MPVLQTASGAERLESIGFSTAPTAGAEVTIDLSTGARLHKWTAAEAETVNASGVQRAGQLLVCQILDSGTRTITFGTGFKAVSTQAGTNGKTATFTFMSDGTNFYELGRALEIT